MRLVLLGPPGAGKGTQAILLSKQFGIPHISTGEILRAHISSSTPLGKEAKGFLDAGELLPDELMIRIVYDRLAQPDCGAGFLLDGFPRTVFQAEELDAHLGASQGAGSLAHVIQLTVPEALLMERIRLRSAKSVGAGRSDDNAEVAARRLQVYWAQTAPVADYYRKRAVLREIDGVGTVEEVTGRIIKATEGV